MDTLYYSESKDHLLAELERIDLLIQSQVQRARQNYNDDREFQGLYISEQEVNELLATPAGLPSWANDTTLSDGEIVEPSYTQLCSVLAQRKIASIQQGIVLRLAELQRFFDLTPFDLDVLLICLAPELDTRYEKLYAYLQDDVTKKRPSVDLVLNLLCTRFNDKIIARQRFGTDSPLIAHQIVTLFDDPSRQMPPFLGKYLKLDERIAEYLLESNGLDPRITRYAHHVSTSSCLQDLTLPENLMQQVEMLVETRKLSHAPIFYFCGPYGVGKQSAAEALCRELKLSLLIIDLAQLLKTDCGFESMVQLIAREALLQGAALYWKGFDSLLSEEQQSHMSEFFSLLEGHDSLSFLVGNTLWEPRDAWHSKRFLRYEFPLPDYAERRRLWSISIPATNLAVDVDLDVIADRFRFTGGQIRDAIATAANLAAKRNPGEVQVTKADLFEACRLQSNRVLATQAQRIMPHHTWDDIVLPADHFQQLQEIFNTVQYRSKVYNEWGFEDKLSLGKGLNILFTGPSGTGKTMAAEIIAGELGLELYKIDLSTIVSKYIGETEKNLSHIFTEAETANAILFFDEADALFGKRSEVRDSHDRYANIEVGYLLQRMEEYEGAVILATNFRKNMDEAFVRRMHFTIEFPLPSTTDRLRIWHGIWPQHTPLNNDIDFDLLAERFELTGGNIKNIALAAAFLAADSGGDVSMDHLIHATQREYQKIGRLVMDDKFHNLAQLRVADQ